MKPKVDTGRIHTAEPQPQNIPIRTPEGAPIRRMFVRPTPPLTTDFSELELRLLVQMNMIRRGTS